MPDNIFITVALLIGPLVGAVVGFAVQLHVLRQARLNFEKMRLEVDALQERARTEEDMKRKLQLEIQELRARQEERNKSPLLQSLSNDEVLRFADIRFSRRKLAADTPMLSRAPSHFSKGRRYQEQLFENGKRWLFRSVVLAIFIIASLLLYRYTN